MLIHPRRPVVRTRDRAKVFTHKHIHTRQQGRDACSGGRSPRQPTQGRARAAKGAPIKHLKWLKCRYGNSCLRLGGGGFQLYRLRRPYLRHEAATKIKLAKADVARIEGERKSEVARIHDKAATEIKLAATEIARVEDKAASEVAHIEGDRNLSEQHWKAEVERYKHVLELAHSRNFARYQAAILGQREKR